MQFIIYQAYHHFSCFTAADTTPPVITCPANQVANVASNGISATVTYPAATATDNSGGAVTLAYSNPSGSTFNFGTTTVVVTGTDPSGNQGTCTFTVTVQGKAPGVRLESP